MFFTLLLNYRLNYNAGKYFDGYRTYRRVQGRES